MMNDNRDIYDNKFAPLMPVYNQEAQRLTRGLQSVCNAPQDRARMQQELEIAVLRFCYGIKHTLDGQSEQRK